MQIDPRAFVRFKQVQKSYDGRTLVVRSLSLSIAKGEFLTMLGPSGSGKTTSLMMLAGFEMPTAGQITVAGRDLTHLPPHKRDIGMVFQNYALFPHMTAGENVAFPLMARGVAKADIAARVREALVRVKMEQFADRRPLQLSGGQQQRIALARALVFEPTLVLMDEPLGALDKQLREHMQMEIKHLHGELGITVIYVTHDQDEALAMSDRIAVFSNGQVEQIGSAKEIYEAPQTAFVSSFVGENNHIDAQVISLRGDGTCIADAAGTKIQCAAIGDLYEGEKIVISLRPERIVVTRGDGAFANRVAAVITEIVYFGDHLRLSCRLTGGATLSVKLSNSENLSGYVVGQSVVLGWHAGDCRGLAHGGGGRS